MHLNIETIRLRALVHSIHSVLRNAIRFNGRKSSRYGNVRAPGQGSSDTANPYSRDIEPSAKILLTCRFLSISISRVHVNEEFKCLDHRMLQDNG
jgi:hypothetical protein